MGRYVTRTVFARQSLFFTDPAGNYYSVYTPTASKEVSNNSNTRMTAVGYIELEAPDVEASINFYQNVLGFEIQSRNAKPQQATLKMAAARL
jgi:catechol-2,3-dioxygenase